METHLPLQPPPDAPAPLPGPEAIRSRRKMGAILWVGSICCIGLLVVAAVPIVLKELAAADRVHALSNLKQLNLSLIDFENDYGRFPDASTIPSVKATTHTTIPLGTKTSNDYFRQLIATGSNERFFWAKTATTTHKPDGNITGTHALEKGECAYAYVAGLSTKDDPDTPVAMAPMISGMWQFDPKPYGNQSVIMRADGSVTFAPLDPHGDMISHGVNIFDTRQPYWNHKSPDLKWPE